MAGYDNEMKGALFPNDKKENARHPDRKGSATIDGVEYWVSAWDNESKAGTPYISLKFEKKDANWKPKPGQTTAQAIDDSVPF